MQISTEQAEKDSIKTLEKNRSVMVLMREFHDVARELIDKLKAELPDGDPRIEDACGISNDIHGLSVRVLGGIGSAVAVCSPKRFMTREND